VNNEYLLYGYEMVNLEVIADDYGLVMTHSPRHMTTFVRTSDGFEFNWDWAGSLPDARALRYMGSRLITALESRTK
jgi:hypothetical protein